MSIIPHFSERGRPPFAPNPTPNRSLSRAAEGYEEHSWGNPEMDKKPGRGTSFQKVLRIVHFRVFHVCYKQFIPPSMLSEAYRKSFLETVVIESLACSDASTKNQPNRVLEILS